MSLKDGLFSDDAEEDLQQFLKNGQRKRVLVFPPVNNYRRFLIHQLVQERYSDLQTFSIGQGFARRTVVCYKSDYIGPPKVNGVLQTNDVFPTKSHGMGIENHLTPNASPERRFQKPKQSKPACTYEIYRPPALRRGRPESSPVMEQKQVQEEQSSPDTSVNARVNRPKRPDRAVYVPRHRRSAHDVESKIISDVQEPQVKPKIETTRMVQRRQLNRNSFNQVKEAKHKEKEIKNCAAEKVDEQTTYDDKVIDDSISEKIIPAENTVVDSLSEKPVEVVSETPLPMLNLSNIENPVISNHIVTNSIPEKMEAQEEIEKTQTIHLYSDVDQEISKDILLSVEEVKVEQLPSNEVLMCEEKKMDEDLKLDIQSENVSSFSESPEKSVSEYSSTISSEVENNKIESVAPEVVEDSCVMDISVDNETNVIDLQISKTDSNFQENVKLVEEPVKQTLVSKVLIISTSDEKKTETEIKPTAAPVIVPPEKKKVKKIEKPKIKPVSPPPPTTTTSSKKMNRDECDWDSLFDDNGECLDPTLMEELTASVGEVVIEKPKSSYKSFKRPVEVSSDEYGHVIEIYNFPSEFKSSDIAAVFSPFKNGGFTLKWVDDTHCLGVFSSPIVAAEVLASDHPFVKTRPLSEATPLSRSKAQKSSESLQPYRARPETCAALARRLVTKSLGVKLATAKEEREQEKIVLREAKEKRRLANKQRDDVWEGIIAEKSPS